MNLVLVGTQLQAPGWSRVPPDKGRRFQSILDHCLLHFLLQVATKLGVQLVLRGVVNVTVKSSRLVDAPHSSCCDPQLQFDTQQTTEVGLALHVRKPRSLGSEQEIAGR